MFAIKQIRGSWTLRIDRDGELEGLDIVEHGTPAYHVEFGYGMSYTTPTGSNVGGGVPPVDSRRHRRATSRLIGGGETERRGRGSVAPASHFRRTRLERAFLSESFRQENTAWLIS